MKFGLNFYQVVIGFQLGVFGAIAIANAAFGQTIADDAGSVCFDRYGHPIECTTKAFPTDSSPTIDRGNGRQGTGASRSTSIETEGDRLEHRGSGRKDAKKCDRYGQPSTGRPRCTITSLPEAIASESSNEDPDLTGQPGTPERTQGSGTRAIED